MNIKRESSILYRKVEGIGILIVDMKQETRIQIRRKRMYPEAFTKHFSAGPFLSSLQEISQFDQNRNHYQLKHCTYPCGTSFDPRSSKIGNRLCTFTINPSTKTRESHFWELALKNNNDKNKAQ